MTRIGHSARTTPVFGANSRGSIDDTAGGKCSSDEVTAAPVLTQDDADTWETSGVEGPMPYVLACTETITSAEACMECLDSCFAERIEAPIEAYEFTCGSSTPYGSPCGGWIQAIHAHCGPVWVQGACCYLVTTSVTWAR